ncbi:hypothetical protein ACLB2K_064075 [Fragaria x ananassa]
MRPRLCFLRFSYKHFPRNDPLSDNRDFFTEFVDRALILRPHHPIDLFSLSFIYHHRFGLMSTHGSAPPSLTSARMSSTSTSSSTASTTRPTSPSTTSTTSPSPSFETAPSLLTLPASMVLGFMDFTRIEREGKKINNDYFSHFSRD